MSTNELLSTVNELQELKRMQEELASEIEALTDRVRDHMRATEADTAIVGAYKVMYKPITSSRLDSTALKKALPDVAERFTKQSTSYRLTIN